MVWNELEKGRMEAYLFVCTILYFCYILCYGAFTGGRSMYRYLCRGSRQMSKSAAPEDPVLEGEVLPPLTRQH